MNRFPSSKNKVTITILWGLILFILGVLIFSQVKTKSPLVPIIVAVLLVGILIWIVLDTRYVIRNGNLMYRSGPFRGKIAIDKIISITYHSGLYVPVTMKPALDTKGFIIKYNQFEEIYVSPKFSNEFIKKLLENNFDIKVLNFSV